MHCPNCGTAAVKQQKFCRAYGFSLEQVAQLLDEAGHALPDSSAPDELDERARSQVVARHCLLHLCRDYCDGAVGISWLWHCL